MIKCSFRASGQIKKGGDFLTCKNPPPLCRNGLFNFLLLVGCHALFVFGQYKRARFFIAAPLCHAVMFYGMVGIFMLLLGKPPLLRVFCVCVYSVITKVNHYANYHGLVVEVQRKNRQVSANKRETANNLSIVSCCQKDAQGGCKYTRK